jgi:hypothetical protein
LLAAIALFLVLVGSATLGVERLVDALENTRSDRLPAYNSAATSWRFGGSAAFANKTRGLELRVNGAPTPLVPRNGTERFSEISAVVPAEISDARDDVVRVRSTHVLYASIPRTTDTDNNTDFNSILVPPGVLVTFVVGYSNHNHAGAAPPNVGPAGVDGRAVAFAPFACAVWSHSLVSARDRVDCDACVEVQTRASADASARCKAACDEPKSGPALRRATRVGQTRRARRGGRDVRRRKPGVRNVFSGKTTEDVTSARPHGRGVRVAVPHRCGVSRGVGNGRGRARVLRVAGGRYSADARRRRVVEYLVEYLVASVGGDGAFVARPARRRRRAD